MATVIKLEKESSVEKGFVGFSWTTLFFGFFVPLFRGDVKWFLIMLILSLLSMGFAQLILAFLYNRIYTREKLREGFYPADDFSKSMLLKKGFIV